MVKRHACHAARDTPRQNHLRLAPYCIPPLITDNLSVMRGGIGLSVTTHLPSTGRGRGAETVPTETVRSPPRRPPVPTCSPPAPPRKIFTQNPTATAPARTCTALRHAVAELIRHVRHLSTGGTTFRARIPAPKPQNSPFPNSFHRPSPAAT